jgi:pyridoxamine 5'-phosphate oxidase
VISVRNISADLLLHFAPRSSKNGPMALVNIRKDYTLAELKREDLHSDPIKQFQLWFKRALESKVIEPNAMTLATADAKGKTSARIVLLRGVDARGFSFFTNYGSRKGKELSENKNAALVFFWAALERQVCVRGKAYKLSREESEKYFHSRPRVSQLGAWVSQQSSVIQGREELDNALEKMAKKYEGKKVPMPPYWGGYLLVPDRIEFWQGRASRLHDRFCYTKVARRWKIQRLAP